MTTIYILRLQGGHYYVGKSDNVMQRYKQHLDGKGSVWTKTFRPVSVERTIESQTSFDEDNYTKEYMKKYGVDKVRGGSYANIVLTDEQEATLKREFRGADDRCQRCGRAGHFIGTCYAKTEVENVFANRENLDEDVFMSTGSHAELSHETKRYRTVPQKRGRDLPRRCARKRMYDHDDSNDDDNSHDDEDEYDLDDDSDACFRCGRDGHYSSQCYASRDMYGNRL